jgi:hypothetical protein
LRAEVNLRGTVASVEFLVRADLVG